MAGEPLIDVRGLTVGFKGRAGAMLPVLRDVDLSVARGQTVGLVGESGSGKSTLALAAMGYLKLGLKVMGGEARFAGRDMFALSPDELRGVRGGRLALIPQNSGQSLTPTMRIGEQLAESLALHSALPHEAHADRVVELLSQVRLPDPKGMVARYPHELSGGQQQRVAVAMAMAGEPEALLLDEPTTGLDVTTQAHILELLRELAARTGMAMVYVSHDLGVIARVCDSVVVMYAGEVVLGGPARRVLRDPSHPYARGLLASIPRLSDTRLPTALDGRPPAPGAVVDACGFADRCSLVEARCRSQRPAFETGAEGESVRCHRHALARTLPVRAEGKAAVKSAFGAPALSLEGLAISYAKPTLLDQILRRKPKATPTVADVSIDVRKGETIGLVGESGSGKSTILKTVAGLVLPSLGRISLADGEALPEELDQRTPALLRRVQLVFQNPDESLNPRHTIQEILSQPLKLYLGLTGDKLRETCGDLLERVRLGRHYLDRLPSQLSGGEKQRVAIARAFAAEPEIVLCDEVTSALDVSVQAAILDLLDRLKRDRGTTYIFVSHDLAVVRAISDRVAVLYQGRLCEIGTAANVYAFPSHPYTEALLGAALEPDPDSAPRLTAADVLESSPPARGCPFQRRCPRRIGPICDEQTPPWSLSDTDHAIRCHIPRGELQAAQSSASCPA